MMCDEKAWKGQKRCDYPHLLNKLETFFIHFVFLLVCLSAYFSQCTTRSTNVNAILVEVFSLRPRRVSPHTATCCFPHNFTHKHTRTTSEYRERRGHSVLYEAEKGNANFCSGSNSSHSLLRLLLRERVHEPQVSELGEGSRVEDKGKSKVQYLIM